MLARLREVVDAPAEHVVYALKQAVPEYTAPAVAPLRLAEAA